jgi:hypothetical protein
MAISVGNRNEATSTASVLSPFVVLGLTAGLPVIVSIWLLLSPGRVVSREMTWDMLFIVEGAWHVFEGQVPHVDFHDPVGGLNFLLTAAGFHLVGLKPFALLVGPSLLALALFACASIAAAPRLPLLAATLFVVFASLLVLMPANAGDLPSEYSFAMSYNRYGWSALSIVALILFLPTQADGDGGIVDRVLVAVLLLALFYIKITYFAAGMGALAFAIIVCPAVRAHWRAWTAVGVLLAANVLAPYNRPYLDDLWANVISGAVKSNYVLQLNYFLSDGTEHALYIAMVAAAAWLWWRGAAPLRVPLAAAFLVGMGWLLLSQNSQFNGVPLAVVVALLLYDVLRRHRVGAPALLLLILPAMWIIAAAASVAGHHFKTRDPGLSLVESANLRGLLVPTEANGLLSDFASGEHPFQLLSRARVNRPRHELSPYEYVQTITEAASLLSKPQYRRGTVVVLDQVNPMPFVLGWPPPRGGNLWSGPHIPQRPAEQLLGTADYVLVPKFSTIGAWTEAAITTLYGRYLADHFRDLEESQSWRLLGRNPAAPWSP